MGAQSHNGAQESAWHPRGSVFAGVEGPCSSSTPPDKAGRPPLAHEGAPARCAQELAPVPRFCAADLWNHIELIVAPWDRRALR